MCEHKQTAILFVAGKKGEYCRTCGKLLFHPAEDDAA